MYSVLHVLVLTGNSHTHMAGRGVLQEIERQQDANSLAVFEPIAKRIWRPTGVERLPRVLQRAFAEMLTGRRGPVVIDLPMDVQCDSINVRAGLPSPEKYRPGGAVLPDPGRIEVAGKLLAGAARPVIVAGGGVIAAGAWDELQGLAEFLGAPVVTTMMGKRAFPEDHPLAGLHGGSKGTTCGNTLTAKADVLLAVGMRFADESTSSYRHGVSYAIPPTQLIHMDLDPTEIGKNYPVEVGYDIPVVYVVANNVGWIAIRDLQAAVYGEQRAAGAEFLKDGAPISPDLAALARAFGCHAEGIEAPDEVRPALERAFTSDRPAVVEVMVERTYPLSGNPAVGWWDVPVPTYLTEQRERYERERAEER